MVDPPCRQYMSEELTVNDDTEMKEKDDTVSSVTGQESGEGEVEEPKRTRVVIQEVASDYVSGVILCCFLLFDFVCLLMLLCLFMYLALSL